MNFGQAAHIQHRRLLEPTLPTLNDVMLHGKTKTKKSMRDESKQCVRFQYMIACVLFESRTCRARFPADQGSLDAAVDSRQLSSILVFVCNAPAGRGLQHGLASLGLLSSWLSSAGVPSVVRQSCRQGSFEPRYTLPKLWQICFRMASFGHFSVRIWIKPCRAELVRWHRKL